MEIVLRGERSDLLFFRMDVISTKPLTATLDSNTGLEPKHHCVFRISFPSLPPPLSSLHPSFLSESALLAPAVGSRPAALSGACPSDCLSVRLI